MKKNYVRPDLDIREFDWEDMMKTSGFDPDAGEWGSEEDEGEVTDLNNL